MVEAVDNKQPAVEDKQVWIADDLQVIRFKIGKALKAEGYTVREFKNADEIITAIEGIGENPKNIAIVTDNQMPNHDCSPREKNGIEVLKAANGKKIPVLMISASKIDKQMEEVKSAGTTANGFFDKSNNDYIPDLISKVKELIGQAASPTQQPQAVRAL